MGKFNLKYLIEHNYLLSAINHVNLLIMNSETLDKPYIITYTNHFEFNERILSYRKKLLFDITQTPMALFLSNNNGSNGYWINRKWLSESMIRSLIKNIPIDVDVSNLQWYKQEQLNHVFNI